MKEAIIVEVQWARSGQNTVTDHVRENMGVVSEKWHSQNLTSSTLPAHCCMILLLRLGTAHFFLLIHKIILYYLLLFLISLSEHFSAATTLLQLKTQCSALLNGYTVYEIMFPLSDRLSTQQARLPELETKMYMHAAISHTCDTCLIGHVSF